MNPMDLKRGIDMAVEAVVEDIKKRARKVETNAEVAQVGTISANGDKSVGEHDRRGDLERVGNEGVITVEEAKSLDTELEVVRGHAVRRGYSLARTFVTNAEKMVCELENPVHPAARERSCRTCRRCCRFFESVVQSSRPLADSSPRTSRARRWPRWWSTSCAAA